MKNFNVDLIITGDWHLREDQPKCRTDNFWKAQWDKVAKVFYLQYEFGCPIYTSGDFFHKWKTSPYLLNKCIKKIDPFESDQFYAIIGNHDMPAHNLDDMDKSGLQTLFEIEKIKRLETKSDWGFDPEKINYTHIGKSCTIAVAHIMTWKGSKPWPNCTDPECHELFDMFPHADLIITGHNHKTFTAKKGKRLLVNPGSLTRQTADQIDHKPCVFLYDAKRHKLKKHTLEHSKDVISRDHIDIKTAKNKRLESFIKKLHDGWDLSLSFEQNMERALKHNNVPAPIKSIINRWMDEK